MPILLTLLGLALMALLPVTFFRRGRLNLRWWLTAVPFVLAALALLAEAASPGSAPRSRPATDVLSIVASAAALGLLLAARAAHARPIALWHQDATPELLVSRGPYAAIRHPFYTAFLLLLLAAALAAPGPATAVALGWGVVALWLTARSEERMLLQSSLGESYRAYAARTGRFLPRMRRRTP